MAAVWKVLCLIVDISEKYIILQRLILTLISKVLWVHEADVALIRSIFPRLTAVLFQLFGNNVLATVITIAVLASWNFQFMFFGHLFAAFFNQQKQKILFSKQSKIKLQLGVIPVTGILLCTPPYCLVDCCLNCLHAQKLLLADINMKNDEQIHEIFTNPSLQ